MEGCCKNPVRNGLETLQAFVYMLRHQYPNSSKSFLLFSCIPFPSFGHPTMSHQSERMLSGDAPVSHVYPCICTSCEKLMGFSMLVQCLYVCGHNKFIEGKQHFLFYILFGRLCDCVTEEVVISVMEMCDYRGHCTSLYQHSRMMDCTCV